jgi:hypothetical protein
MVDVRDGSRPVQPTGRTHHPDGKCGRAAVCPWQTLASCPSRPGLPSRKGPARFVPTVLNRRHFGSRRPTQLVDARTDRKASSFGCPVAVLTGYDRRPRLYRLGRWCSGQFRSQLLSKASCAGRAVTLSGVAALIVVSSRFGRLVERLRSAVNCGEVRLGPAMIGCA